MSTATTTKNPPRAARTPIAERPLAIPFTVVIDTRESAPYSFAGLKADAKDHCRPLVIPAEFHGLPTGDYSIAGLESQVVIERKSLADLYSTLAAGRERFEREHERMAEIVTGGGFAAVVIEASWSQILNHPPQPSRLNPKTVFRTWLSWSVRYRVQWMAVDGRRLGEVTTFRLLEKFWNERQSLVSL